jgi:SAM-dependent methyltransferase
VLELGCGDGGNLIPMAVGLPGARLVGVDAAPGAIARGRATAHGLGLRNVTLEVGAIEALEPAPGSFDYVIAHGVYSWVPAPVRDRLLALCRSVLSPQGVAYVSYNALPGGRLREALGDMLRFHAGAVEPPAERVGHARALLRFLLTAWPEEHEFGAAMRRHAEGLLERRDETVFHDELAAVNEPCYFHEFAAHAGRHGLQYLAEADFFEMQTGAVSDDAAAELLRVDDPIRREQYLDFVKGRMFRQTLLCREELALDRAPRPEALAGLAVAAPVVRASDEPDAAGRITFAGPSGSTLTTDHPVVIAALGRVGERWPAAVPVRELLPTDEDRAALCEALLRAYAANLVQLHVRPPALTTAISERPEASPLARHQARAGTLVTNLRHATVRIEDELGRRLVAQLDGTRDRAMLLGELPSFLAHAGRPVPDDFEDGLERSLRGLAAKALLLR